MGCQTMPTNSKAKLTRRDFIFVNRIMIPAVAGVRVEMSDVYPTHQPLQISLATNHLQVIYRKLRKTSSAVAAVEANIEEEREELAGRQAVKRKIDMKAELHSMMDEQLEQRKMRMEKAEVDGDTTIMSRFITASLEAAFVRYLGLNKTEAKAMRGRAAITIQREDLKPELKRPKEAKGRIETWRRRAGLHSAQANRLQHVAKRMKAVARMRALDPMKEANTMPNSCTIDAYNKEASKMGFRGDTPTDIEGCEGGGKEYAETVMACNLDNATQSATLERIAAKNYGMRGELNPKIAAECASQQRSENEERKRGLKVMSRKVDGPAAAPLVFVKRDAQSSTKHEAGSFTTNLDEIDVVVRRAWRSIYQGNTDDVAKVVKLFVGHMKNLEEHGAEEIAKELVHAAFSRGGKSSAGMGGWEPEVFALMSMDACSWTARLYKMIEAGAEWPQGTMHGKAAFLLQQEGAKPGEVMSYRVLLIMAVLYREWGSMTRRSLEPWVNKWTVPEMYAGAGNQGAEDAWYQTLLDLELLNLDCGNYCGGTADIWKLFDQIQRPMVYQLAEMAGMPAHILDAYKRFQEGLLVHNSLAGGIGQPYKRQCSMPQECPLSMMIVALIMRPWLQLMKEMNVDLKVLADDVIIIAKATRMIKRLAGMINATHAYLHDLGPKVAPSKCFNFASSTTARKRLAETWRQGTASKLPVVKDFRYLGTHLNTGRGRKAVTLDKVHAGAFYGTEASDYIYRQ